MVGERLFNRRDPASAPAHPHGGTPAPPPSGHLKVLVLRFRALHIRRKEAAVPPRKTPGEALVASVLDEMKDAGLVPDAKEQALLDAARQLVDRIDKLETIIQSEGEMLTSSTGVVRVHPAVSEHRQLCATLPKVLGGIVIGDSSDGKNRVKQAAANRRWDLERARRG